MSFDTSIVLPETPIRNEGQFSRAPVTPMTAPARLAWTTTPSFRQTPSVAATVGKAPKPQETDARRLEQRGKQIAFGKATLGYKLWKLQCEIGSTLKERSPHGEIAKHATTNSDADNNIPRTPRCEQRCSKRAWDAQVRDWRVRLHRFDPATEDAWREALRLFPRETLELASAAAQGSLEKVACMPPQDIIVQASMLVLPETAVPVARCLDLDGEI